MLSWKSSSEKPLEWSWASGSYPWLMIRRESPSRTSPSGSLASSGRASSGDGISSRRKPGPCCTLSDNFLINGAFRATYSPERNVKVDLIILAEIIKMINLTSAELEGHRAAVTCGQLTEDQKECQQKTRIRQSQEISKDEENENIEESITLRGRIRRRSIIFNNAIGKQLKSSMKRTPTQMLRTKVVVETSFLNHSPLQFRVQPLTFLDGAAPCMIWVWALFSSDWSEPQILSMFIYIKSVLLHVIIIWHFNQRSGVRKGSSASVIDHKAENHVKYKRQEREKSKDHVGIQSEINVIFNQRYSLNKYIDVYFYLNVCSYP